MTDTRPETADPESPADEGEAQGLACVLCFNANDPSGAGGLSGDVLAMGSVGAHTLPVVTGTYVRDTSGIQDFFALDEEVVGDQARGIAEDVPIQVIKVGFAGSPENIALMAEMADDYDGVPVVAYMPNLSWWEDDKIDDYLDAFRELMLPQTSVLVGHHSTLRRWLLPDWSGERNPGPRDIAKAASELGVPYTLVTGIPLPDQQIENVLASPETVLCHARFELFDATFTGAGDTLTTALAALLACGSDLATACTEALDYLDRCLDAGFRPGMGHVIPDRMFWAEPEEADNPSSDDDKDDQPSLEGYGFPSHDTKH